LDAIYRTTGKNDGLVLVQNGSAVVLDLSNGSYTQLSNDFALVGEACATEVDVLLLSHYHERHPNAILRFAKRAKVREVWAPSPTDEAEVLIFNELAAVAERARITLKTFERNEKLAVLKGAEVTLSELLFDERSVEPAFCLSVSLGGSQLLYQSDAYSEYARLQGVEKELSASHLILGGHGPVPHEEIAPALGAGVQDVLLSDRTAKRLLSPSLAEIALTEERKFYRLTK
jgi:glyoxylase-like metal-dependent hydrolase (beta-lactamase superfamily II)